MYIVHYILCHPSIIEASCVYIEYTGGTYYHPLANNNAVKMYPCATRGVNTSDQQTWGVVDIVTDHWSMGGIVLLTGIQCTMASVSIDGCDPT